MSSMQVARLNILPVSVIPIAACSEMDWMSSLVVISSLNTMSRIWNGSDGSALGDYCASGGVDGCEVPIVEVIHSL